METKDKILIGGVFFFAVIIFMANKFDNEVCEPLMTDVEKKLDYLESKNSIEKIVLRKTYRDRKENLVSNPIVLEDSATLETIRNMIDNKQTGTWNKPTTEWNVTMEITLKNQEVLSVRVERIDNDENADMTQLFFGACLPKSPNYSLTLGKYLEELTGYNKVVY